MQLNDWRRSELFQGIYRGAFLKIQEIEGKTTTKMEGMRKKKLYSEMAEDLARVNALYDPEMFLK